MCSTALPFGFWVSVKVTVSASLLSAGVLIGSPGGAAGWVDTRSCATSLNA